MEAPRLPCARGTPCPGAPSPDPPPHRDRALMTARCFVPLLQLAAFGYDGVADDANSPTALSCYSKLRRKASDSPRDLTGS